MPTITNILQSLSSTARCSVVLSLLFLCGCGSDEAGSDREATARYKQGLAYKADKKFPQAVASFQQAVVLKPDYADAYFGLGMAYGQLERFPEAIKAYQEFIALEPKGVRSILANSRIVDMSKKLLKK